MKLKIEIDLKDRMKTRGEAKYAIEEALRGVPLRTKFIVGDRGMIYDPHGNLVGEWRVAEDQVGDGLSHVTLPEYIQP